MRTEDAIGRVVAGWRLAAVGTVLENRTVLCYERGAREHRVLLPKGCEDVKAADPIVEDWAKRNP